MDKSKNNEKYHFMIGDVFVMKANEKKVKNMGTWVLTLVDYPVFVYELFNSNLL